MKPKQGTVVGRTYISAEKVTKKKMPNPHIEKIIKKYFEHPELFPKTMDSIRQALEEIYTLGVAQGKREIL